MEEMQNIYFNALLTELEDPQTDNKTVQKWVARIRTNVKSIEIPKILAKAVKSQKLDALRKLVQNGIDINTQNEDGDTILVYALELFDWRTAKILIEELGADVTLKNNKGKSPYDLLKQHISETGNAFPFFSPSFPTGATEKKPPSKQITIDFNSLKQPFEKIKTENQKRSEDIEKELLREPTELLAFMETKISEKNKQNSLRNLQNLLNKTELTDEDKINIGIDIAKVSPIEAAEILYTALEKRNKEYASMLVIYDNGNILNAQDYKNKNTLLHRFLATMKWEIARQLIEFGADCTIGGYKEISPYNLLQQIINKANSPDSRTKQHLSELKELLTLMETKISTINNKVSQESSNIAVSPHFLQDSQPDEQHNITILLELLRKSLLTDEDIFKIGGVINKLSPMSVATFLHAAAHMKNIKYLNLVLTCHTREIMNTQDERKNTILHHSLANKNLETAAKLVELGADCNLPGYNDITPYELLKKMIEHEQQKIPKFTTNNTGNSFDFFSANSPAETPEKQYLLKLEALRTLMETKIQNTNITKPK